MTPLAALPLLVLLWSFDRTAPPTDFLVIVESVEAVTGIQQLLVAGVPEGVCTNVKSGETDDFCTTLACPGPGTFRITVEARKYQSRSNTVQFRVLDAACTRVEGIPTGAGPVTGIPAAGRCRGPKPVALPPVEVVVPAKEPRTVAIPTPHDTAPVIPVNPKVIPKTPHRAGEGAHPVHERQAKAPREVTDPPESPKVTLPTGKPTTIVVQQPPVTEPGVPCQ